MAPRPRTVPLDLSAPLNPFARLNLFAPLNLSAPLNLFAPHRLRGLATRVAAIAVALVAAACTSFPAAAPSNAGSPTPPPNAAIAATRAQIEVALRQSGYALLDYQQPFRPPETATLSASPRALFQAVLPDDPTHGVIAVYDLGDAGRAGAAASEFAQYLASGPTRVQFAPDTRFVLRQLGSTLVFYTWSAANAQGSSGAGVADVLDRLGQGFPVR